MSRLDLSEPELSYLLSCIFKAKFGGDIREEYLFNDGLVSLFKKILSHAEENHPNSQVFRGRSNQPFSDLVHSEVWAEILSVIKGLKDDRERLSVFRTAIYPFHFEGSDEDIREIIEDLKIK